MKPISDLTVPKDRNSTWPGVIKFFLLVLLIVIVFLLGQDMVRHRFFRGGWVNQQGVLEQ